MSEENKPLARRSVSPLGAGEARHGQRGAAKLKALAWLLVVGLFGFVLSFSFHPPASNASDGSSGPDISKPLDDCRNPSGDPAATVRSCTTVIDSRKLEDSDEISALNNRGIAYKDEGDFAHAIQDFSQVLSIQPEYQEALNNRGALYMTQGNYDRAIADYSKVLELNPDYPLAVRSRSVAYLGNGDFADAIRDLDHALNLNPQDSEALQMRGALHYFGGDYKNALEDETSAVTADRSDPYSAIWLYLARARNGKDSPRDSADELALNSANLSMDWPWPVIQMYLGKANAEDVVARGSADAQLRNDRMCEAYFYLGQRALITGNTSEAQRDFEAALSAGGDKSNIEYRGAEAELARVAKK